MNTIPPIRVLIADDSTHVRRRLVALLGELEHVCVVGEAEDVGHTLQQVDQLHPDVVVLDINMPGGTGIKALKHIKRTHPATEVIMLTNHADAFYRRACTEAGALFFFDKSIEFERVGDALRGMHAAA